MGRWLKRNLLWLGPVLVLLCLLVIGALDASRSVADRMGTYAEQMYRALGVPSDPSTQAALPSYPPRRDLRFPIQDLRIGLLDLLEIQGCELGVLVGERNSPLGRVMPASERWLYEARLVDALVACPTDEPELAEELRLALDVKRSELPKHRFHTIWGGPELRALLTAPAAEAPAQVAEQVARGLEELEALDAAPQQAPQRLRSALQAIYDGRHVGGVLRSLARVARGLESIARATQRAIQRPRESRCLRAGRVRELFAQHYVGGIQPRLSELDRASTALLDGLASLALRSLERTGTRPASFEAYAAATFAPQDASTALRERFHEATRAHARALTAYAEACGFELMRPQQSPQTKKPWSPSRSLQHSPAAHWASQKHSDRHAP